MKFTQLSTMNWEISLTEYDDLFIDDHRFHDNVQGFPDNPNDREQVPDDSFFDFNTSDIIVSDYQDHGNDDDSTVFYDPNIFNDISKDQYTLLLDDDDKSQLFPHHLETIDNNKPSAFPEKIISQTAPQLEVENIIAVLPEMDLLEAKQEGGNNNNNGKVISRIRPKSSRLDMNEIKNHFHVPISRAAKEMNVGLTVLKKRCRELNIGRWPHRKLKSLKTLIANVKDMGLTDDREIEMLEEQSRMLELVPHMEISEKTKKLRQACFKATYKKRKSLAIASTLTPASAYYSTTTSFY